MPIKPLNIGNKQSQYRVNFNDRSDTDTESEESSLGHVGRDSFRSLTSETLGEDSEDEREDLDFHDAVQFDREPHHVRTRSNSHDRTLLDFSNMSDVPLSRSCASSAGSRGKGGFSGKRNGFDPQHRRLPSNTSHTSKSSNGSTSSSPRPRLSSSPRIVSVSPRIARSSPLAASSPRRRRARPQASPAAAGASVFRASLPTCRASDARKHKKASKWDTAEFEPSDSDDNDDLLDNYSRGGRQNRGPNKSGGGFALDGLRGKVSPHRPPQHGFAGFGRRNAALRRVMSEHHDEEEVAAQSPIDLKGIGGVRRQTLNPATVSRRRPSHLGSLNLCTLSMAKPKYDSAHMWHLQNQNRPCPQTNSCAESHGFLFLDFDRTLAKEHTFKRSVKLGIKGLKELPLSELVSWFGGQERLTMCKAYLHVLAQMDVATVIITHSMPQLVYQIMRMVGFFPDDDDVDDSPTSEHKTNSFSLAARKVRHSNSLSSPSRGTETKSSPRPFGLNLKLKGNLKLGGPISRPSANHHSTHHSTSATVVNAAISSGTAGFDGKPVPVLKQNYYGIVAVYGQSADSAEKYLKSQCINEVVMKLSGKHAVRHLLHSLVRLPHVVRC